MCRVHNRGAQTEMNGGLQPEATVDELVPPVNSLASVVLQELLRPRVFQQLRLDAEAPLQRHPWTGEGHVHLRLTDVLRVVEADSRQPNQGAVQVVKVSSDHAVQAFQLRLADLRQLRDDQVHHRHLPTGHIASLCAVDPYVPLARSLVHTHSIVESACKLYGHHSEQRNQIAHPPQDNLLLDLDCVCWEVILKPHNVLVDLLCEGDEAWLASGRYTGSFVDAGAIVVHTPSDWIVLGVGFPCVNASPHLQPFPEQVSVRTRTLPQRRQVHTVVLGPIDSQQLRLHGDAEQDRVQRVPECQEEGVPDGFDLVPVVLQHIGTEEGVVVFQRPLHERAICFPNSGAVPNVRENTRDRAEGCIRTCWVNVAGPDCI
mmetsp:Transcript_108252/g.186971  ORF Transcript_108252/g.186971 Transcript_108252/m.186971 type:complete len:373 (-) Transcript_108252:1150-2268(-)